MYTMFIYICICMFLLVGVVRSIVLGISSSGEFAYVEKFYFSQGSYLRGVNRFPFINFAFSFLCMNFFLVLDCCAVIFFISILFLCFAFSFDSVCSRLIVC